MSYVCGIAGAMSASVWTAPAQHQLSRENLKSQYKSNSDHPAGLSEHSPGLSLQLTSMAGFHSPFLQVRYL